MEFDHHQHHHHSRTIAHFDLDAFYVACERELNPSLIGRPVAVSQYNPYGNLHETHSSEIEKRLIVRPPPAVVTARTIQKSANTNVNATTEELVLAGVKGNGDNNGSMIAVSYEARGGGVKRGDRGLDAVKKCPDLHIVQVPVKRGKADLTMYRSAGHRVMECLISSLLNEIDFDLNGMDTETDTNCNVYVETRTDWIGRHILSNMKRADIKVEKASIDEIYIDLSVPVNKMAANLLSLQNFEKSKMAQDREVSPNHHDDVLLKKSERLGNDDYQKSNQVWKDVLFYGQRVGSTSVGGIETMTHAAHLASTLSKDEVRKGSKFQVEEQALDVGSQTWWRRPLEIWTEVELRLACGSALAARARFAAEKKFELTDKLTGMRRSVFTLSGGISSNKTLAKLASGLKKPNRQTMINPCDNGALMALFHPLKINRIRGLGGKFGESVIETLGVSTVGDLAKVPLTVLKQKYPPGTDDERPTADFLWTISKGVCNEDVSERTKEKSISSGKTFRGGLAIAGSNEAGIRKWISELIGGLLDRLKIDHDENMRLPGNLVLSIKMNDVRSHAISKSARAPQTISHEAYFEVAMKLYGQFPIERNGQVFGITVTASNFNTVASGESSIIGAFQRSAQMSSQRSSLASKCLSPKNTLNSQVKKSSLRVPNNLIEGNFGFGHKTRKILPNCIKGENSRLCHGETNVNHDPKNNMSLNRIDESVLSQLPASIRSEIRVANMSRIGGRTLKKSPSVTSAAKMKNWLSNSRSDKRKNTSTSASLNKKEKLSGGGKERPVQNSYNNETEIDTKVLAELPFHIQALIRKEIRASKIRK